MLCKKIVLGHLIERWNSPYLVSIRLIIVGFVKSVDNLKNYR